MSEMIDKLFKPFFHPDADLRFSDDHEEVVATMPNGAKLTVRLNGMKWVGSPTEPLTAGAKVGKDGSVTWEKPGEGEKKH